MRVESILSVLSVYEKCFCFNPNSNKQYKSSILTEEKTYTWESAAGTKRRSVQTHMSIGDVEQVFDPTAFIKMKLVTNGLLDNHIVCLLRGQNLIDVLCGSHSIHLISLQGQRKTFAQFSAFMFQQIISAKHCQNKCLLVFNFGKESFISLTSSVLLSRLMSE